MSDVVIRLGSEKALARALAHRLTGSGYVAVVQAGNWEIHVEATSENGALGKLLKLVELFLRDEAAHATIRVDGRSYVFDAPPPPQRARAAEGVPEPRPNPGR